MTVAMEVLWCPGVVGAVPAIVNDAKLASSFGTSPFGSRHSPIDTQPNNESGIGTSCCQLTPTWRPSKRGICRVISSSDGAMHFQVNMPSQVGEAGDNRAHDKISRWLNNPSPFRLCFIELADGQEGLSCVTPNSKTLI